MLPEVNLLPKYERGESALFTVFVMGLIVSMVLFAVIGYFYFTARGALQDAEENVNTLTQEQELLAAEINQFQSEQDTSFDQALAFVESYQTATSVLVDEFMQLLPDYGYVSAYTYDYETVTVETHFETMTDASFYLGELIDSAYTHDVEIDYMETFTLEEETEETSDPADIYEVTPRYEVVYSIQVNQQSLAGEEENNETAISGE